MLVFAITLGIVALGCCVLADCAGVFDVVFVRVLSELWDSCWYLVASELLACFVLVGFILYYAVIRV